MRRWTLACGIWISLGMIASAPPTTSAAPVPPVTEADLAIATFSDSATVDNQWAPLVPGTEFVFEGAVNDGPERVSHRVVFTVTDLVKTIDGVDTAVIWDRDFTAGELVEAEIAFFAQDDAGNVWLFGEYPEEYEGGKIVDAPTWLSGLAGAEAGVFMRADPQVDTPDYAQGVAAKVGFTDRASVKETGIENCVPYQCFQDVVVTEEYNPDEPGKFQLKYYASGIGNIRVGWAGRREKDKEVLRLVSVRQLDDAELAEVRDAALALEASAYKQSPKMYGKSSPLQQIAA